MERLLDIVVKAVFVENLALSFFLGMCTFLAISRSVRTALGLGAAVIFVQTLTVPLNHFLLHRWLEPGPRSLLPAPGDLDLTFLGLLLYIGVIASVVQVVEMFLDRYVPVLYQTLGIFLPLLTVNCAILGGTLFMANREYTFADSVAYGFGSGLGWAVALAALAGIRERLVYADPPAGLRGLGLAFITTGLMALAFMGFKGIR